MKERIYLREVGPRDGLQLAKVIMATEQKVEWCHAEARAGVSEIEVTSFVPPKIIPQFSDADEVATQALQIPNLAASALVPNLKGALRAFAHGFKLIGFVLSASEKHNLANVRRTTEQSIDEFKDIVAERDRRAGNSPALLSVAIATSFGCTIEGAVPESRVVKIAETVAEAGANEIMLADTVGYGNPAQVRRLFGLVRHAVGEIPLRAHFHDTRGLGIANVASAVDAGVRRFDASLAGLGGCPFAPRATGNVNMEDSAFLLASLGFETGIDIDALIAVRAMVEKWLPGEKFFGMVARAGLPLNFER